MILFPYAKINIGLDVIEKRTDGYHSICSVFYPVLLRDTLEIVPAGNLIFNSSGLPIPGNKDQNLVIKAWELLRDKFKIGPVKIFLDKRIPMGAGLGGGSSDAAFALKIMNQIFDLQLNIDNLMELAAELGSDCPFFLMDAPALATGRGTDLKEIPLYLSKYWLYVISPKIHISTSEAYGELTPEVPEKNLQDLIVMPLEEWKNNIKNDFEKGVFRKYPELNEIKNNLYKRGALYASLTGTGSSVYGIFAERPEMIKSDFPQFVLPLKLP
ncbi:MAG: 4-(cytidine 5'-diphospho)-2-C-methyl-D-erythritol kinase [Cyclobacteriaceae bacterium]|nr:4-(cytidine 5'-diphospho)-2-C-methyl-D-erythritol kinase [Cyclobacteriaceae bacterium]